ncbi:MAG: amidase [Thalassobaculales bacterium]
MTDLIGLTARQAVAQVRAGTLSVEAVVRAQLERIAAREPVIGAWIHLDPEGAIAEAKARDGAPRGPLTGATIGVKDIIDTADMPTGYGSAAYAGFRPNADAPCVCLSRAAGGVALGKTVSTEFAMAAPGTTANPWNPAHTPGGSSSGSAAAVAAGMVHLAFGTQTSGSVIRPAAYCGVAGYKPSFGLIDRSGVKPLSDSLDTVGLMARDVRDLGYFAAVLTDRPGLQVGEEVAAPRIAVFRTSTPDEAQPCAFAALERAAALAAARGATVSAAPLPGWFHGLLAAQDAVMGWEMWRALAYERLCLADRITARTREVAAARGNVTAPEYDHAQAAAAAGRARLEELFGDADVLLTLPAPGEAPAGLGTTGLPLFNRAWTLLRTPCVTVPAGVGPSGLPLGVQVVGRIGADAQVLAAAAFIEAALAGAVEQPAVRAA